MDYNTLIKKLDLSWAKIAWYAVFSRDSLYEYALSKANTAVNLMLEANGDCVDGIRAKLALLNQTLVKYAEYIPVPWKPYADKVNASLICLYNATADHKLTDAECRSIVVDFTEAFSAFMAD